METTSDQLPLNKYAKTDLEKGMMASHGLTKGQLQAVFDAQRNGQSFEQVTANCESEHQINEHEKFLYHVSIKIPQFDPVTGADNSHTHICLFHPAMFVQVQKSGIWDGRIITILHDPTKVRTYDNKGHFAKKPIAKIL